MFLTNYTLFGAELVSWTIETNSSFVLEKDAYSYLKKVSTSSGYKYLRIDTVAQIGFPDILILKADTYCLIEAKRLERKNLEELENDLKWQYGQIAFAVRAFMLDLSYVLVVCKENKLAVIGKERTICHLKKTIRT